MCSSFSKPDKAQLKLLCIWDQCKNGLSSLRQWGVSDLWLHTAWLINSWSWFIFPSPVLYAQSTVQFQSTLEHNLNSQLVILLIINKHLAKININTLAAVCWSYSDKINHLILFKVLSLPLQPLNTLQQSCTCSCFWGKTMEKWELFQFISGAWSDFPGLMEQAPSAKQHFSFMCSGWGKMLL